MRLPHAWRRRRAATSYAGPYAAPLVPREQLVAEARHADEEADQLEDALERIRTATDETARELGHLHPAVTRVRAILDEVIP